MVGYGCMGSDTAHRPRVTQLAQAHISQIAPHTELAHATARKRETPETTA